MPQTVGCIVTRWTLLVKKLEIPLASPPNPAAGVRDLTPASVRAFGALSDGACDEEEEAKSRGCPDSKQRGACVLADAREGKDYKAHRGRREKYSKHENYVRESAFFGAVAKFERPGAEFDRGEQANSDERGAAVERNVVGRERECVAQRDRGRSERETVLPGCEQPGEQCADADQARERHEAVQEAPADDGVGGARERGDERRERGR
jgi:hypothetical protein